MATRSVFNEPKELFNKNEILNFWPIENQSASERVNATARFVVYATCILYLIRRDVRVFILGATALGVLYVMERSNMIKEGRIRPTDTTSEYRSQCQVPTRDNPMGNVLMSDYTDRPDRPSACDVSTVHNDINSILFERIPYGPTRSRSSMPDVQRNAYARQFVTSPVSSIPGDQTEFAEWLYGEKNAPMCKSDGTMCSPNARGVQLEAFGGLDPTGDKRGGMFGGSGRGAGTTSSTFG
jgi:hypothetical protein